MELPGRWASLTLPVTVSLEQRPKEKMEQIDSCLGDSFHMDERTSVKATEFVP